MRGRVIGPVLGAFFLSANPITAVAPSVPREITDFRPVVLPKVRPKTKVVPIVIDSDLTKKKPFPRPPHLNLQPEPIIIKLTPKPARHYTPTVADAKGLTR